MATSAQHAYREALTCIPKPPVQLATDSTGSAANLTDSPTPIAHEVCHQPGIRLLIPPEPAATQLPDPGWQPPWTPPLYTDERSPQAREQAEPGAGPQLQPHEISTPQNAGPRLHPALRSLPEWPSRAAVAAEPCLSAEGFAKQGASESREALLCMRLQSVQEIVVLQEQHVLETSGSSATVRLLPKYSYASVGAAHRTLACSSMCIHMPHSLHGSGNRSCVRLRWECSLQVHMLGGSEGDSAHDHMSRVIVIVFHLLCRAPRASC